MDWLILFLAGLCEIAWAVGLKYTDGFSKPGPTIFTAVTMVVSFVLLSQAMKSLPVGSAYAVWTGIGAVGTAVLGMILFNESRDPIRIVCILLIAAGIFGLKLLTSESGR